MKFILQDYCANKTTVETVKEISAAFLAEISGDQELYVLYSDGTTEIFSGLPDGWRSTHFFDGGEFVDLSKAVDGVLDLTVSRNEAL